MFGMDDPSKVVDQIRSYIAESRLELAEVMAQELSTHLLNSKRDKDLDQVLVLVLREWTLVLFMREQWKDAHSAAVRLAKARKIQTRRIRASGDIDAISNAIQLEVEDLIIHGRIESSRGRLSASRKNLCTSFVVKGLLSFFITIFNLVSSDGDSFKLIFIVLASCQE